MILFACLVFYKRHRLHSRVMVGLAAVAAVMLSMMTAFGVVMMCGIPFTTVSILIPFILFGIGMDDAFIIYGDYSRTDHNADPVERIEHTIDDVGISITLTTITSAFAFGIGCISDIPAVSWLCFYAFPSVLSVYFYQLTFFVAAIVLDERRIKARRQDPFFCCKYRSPAGEQGIIRVGSSDSEGTLKVITRMDAPEEFKIDSFMAAYGEFLLQPIVKKAVIVVFAILSIAGIISASQLRQEFEYADVLPDDSYLADFYAARKSYAVANQLQVGAYFRFVDQSSTNVQEQMKDFVADLVEMDGVSGEPDFFWLREFETFVEETPFVQNLEFKDQLAFFLGVPLYAELFRPDIRLDLDGNILSSRVLINMYDVDQDDVSEQIDMLELQREVSLRQPVNRGRKELAFFTSSSEYNEWEFYSAAVNEMILTAILGITCVSAIAFILVPHWTAILFVFPLIALLYVNLLGVMQWGGVPVSAISYVTMAMAIGLMVDFILHVLLRYYESPGNRHEKTIATLRTMGSSILVGGLSTFLGTLPLLFSTYNMFRAVFLIFLGLVTLGLGFGLILLPVILSIVGTEEQVTTKAHPGLALNRTTEESLSDYSLVGSPISRLSGSLFEAADDVTVFLIGYIMAQTRDTAKRIEPRPDPPYERTEDQAPLLFIPSSMATDSGTESDSDEENESSKEKIEDVEAQNVVKPVMESDAPIFNIVALAPTQTGRDLSSGLDDETSEKPRGRDPSFDSDEEETGSQIDLAKDREKEPLVDSGDSSNEEDAGAFSDGLAEDNAGEQASEPVEHSEGDQASISEDTPQDVDDAIDFEKPGEENESSSVQTMGELADGNTEEVSEPAEHEGDQVNISEEALQDLDTTVDSEKPTEENEIRTVHTKDEPADGNREQASEPVVYSNVDQDKLSEEVSQNEVSADDSENPAEENDDAAIVSDKITEENVEQKSEPVGHAADDLSTEDNAGDSDDPAQVINAISADKAAQDNDANKNSKIEPEQNIAPVVQADDGQQEQAQANDMDELAQQIGAPTDSGKPAEFEENDAVVADVRGVDSHGKAELSKDSNEPSPVVDAADYPEKLAQVENPDVNSSIKTEQANSPISRAVNEQGGGGQSSHLDGGNSASTNENVGEVIAEVTRSSDPPEGEMGRTAEQVGLENSARKMMEKKRAEDPVGALGEPLDEVFC